MNENAGQNSFDLAPHIGLASAADIQSARITANSNPAIFQIAAVADGRFVYQPATDKFGKADVAMEIISRAGRTYIASLALTVNVRVRTIDFTEIVIEENSGQQNLNLLPLMGISDPSLIGTIDVDLLENPSLMAMGLILDGFFIYQPSRNQFGNTRISISITTTEGRPYEGILPVTVTQIPREVTIPEQSVAEGATQQAIPVLAYFGLNTPSELQSISITAQSRPEIFTGVAFIDGFLVFQPAGGRHGSNVLSFEAVGSNGRNFFGEVRLTITPEERLVTIPDVEVVENSGSHSIGLFPWFDLEDGLTIESSSIVSQVPEGLLEQAGMDGMTLNFTTATDRIGNVELKFEAFDSEGRPYSGSITIIILPQKRNLNLPDTLIAANSGVHSVNISSSLNPGSSRTISNLRVIRQSNPSILRELSVTNDTVTFIPVTTGNGSNTIELQARDSIGREYDISMTIVVDTWKYWLAIHFTEEEINNPELEESLWGLTADPDNDDWNNLKEYFFGGEPLIREAKGDWVTPVLIQDTQGERRQALEFNARINDDRIRVSIQTSGDGKSWSTHPVPESSELGILSRTSIDENFDRLRIMEFNPVRPGEPRFMRLKIERQ
jgi:hypothetical protein